MIRYELQFFGGRGAGGGLSDGPSGGGSNETQYGQPNTPIVIPAPTIRMQIGEKGQPISADQAIKTINPDRNVEYGDYSENCQRCVVAFELNRRGYRVEASETYRNDPYPQNANWMKAFKGGKLVDVGGRSTDSINKKIIGNMSGWGNGSRAIVRIKYPRFRTGHVFNVEYKNGKLRYYDAQTGDKYDPKRVFNHVSKQSVQIMRSDNLALNDDVRNMVRKKRK